MVTADEKNDIHMVRAKSIRELARIVTHPAYRIGALDYAAGAPCDHDDIVGRIRRETPAEYFAVMAEAGCMSPFDPSVPFEEIKGPEIILAQVRYEEGRCWLALYQGRNRLGEWLRPDDPPALVRRYLQVSHAKFQQQSMERTLNASNASR